MKFADSAVENAVKALLGDTEIDAADFDQIRELFITGAASLEDLPRFSNLYRLYICESALKDGDILSTLTQLTELSLDNVSGVKSEHIATLTRLTDLSVCNCGQWTLQPLAGLTRLRLLTEVIMVFLAITTVLVAVWLFVPKMPYMKVVLLTALIIGAVVLWADVDTVVARYNVQAYQTKKLETVDVVPAKPEPPKAEEPVLSPAEQKVVDDFAAKIDVENTAQILQYGAGTQKKMADFSDAALANVRTQDLGEVGDLIVNVVGELKGFEAEEEKGFFGFFRKQANKLRANMRSLSRGVYNFGTALQLLSGAHGEDACEESGCC